MAGLSITISTRGGRDLRELSRRLREVEPSLNRRLERGIRRAGAPTLNKLRRAARSIPAEGPKTRGTRDLMARNTEKRDRAGGVRFQVNRLPGDRRNLPPLYEGLRRWRHPVFGNREAWVTQPASPWFYPTTDRAEPDFERACVRVIDEVINELGG